MTRRFQFSIADGLLATAVIAGAVATIASREAVVAFLTDAILLVFLLHRPVLLRLWVVATAGFGAGAVTAMLFRHWEQNAFLYDFRMPEHDLAGWGAGMLTAAFTAYLAFVSNPPPEVTDKE